MAAQTGSDSPGADLRTRHNYVLFVFLLLIVLVQSTLLPRIRVLGNSPDFVLVAVIAWSLLRGINAGLVWGFFAGLGLDLISGMPLGTSSLALMAICFLTRIGTRSVFAGNLVLPVATVAVATAVHGWLTLLILQVRGLPVDWVAMTVRVIGPEILLNAFLLLPVYPALRWLAIRMGANTLNW